MALGLSAGGKGLLSRGLCRSEGAGAGKQSGRWAQDLRAPGTYGKDSRR